MKQLLSLFLFLLPCLALAQYPSNGNQKITLGEQTSADGLVYRGVLADTGIITPSSDTSAYIILDTVNHRFYNYNRATNVWSVTTIGSISSGLTGVLPVANGGTGKSTLLANKVLVGNGTDTVNSPTNLHWRRYSADAEGLGIGTGANTDPAGSTRYHLSVMGGNYVGAYGLIQLMSPSVDAENQAYGVLAFTDQSLSNVAAWMISRRGPVTYSGNYEFATSPGTSPSNIIRRMQIRHDGKIGLGLIDATEILDVDGNARIRAVGNSSSNNSALYVTDGGVLSTNSSDVNKKHNIRNLPYGLNTINQLNPVAFDWNENDITDIGFIAQDIESIIPESVITNWDSQLIFRQEKIVPILVKAIQEQQALIKALEQRIINLENK
jgi:hypothetical protein